MVVWDSLRYQKIGQPMNKKVALRFRIFALVYQLPFSVGLGVAVSVLDDHTSSLVGVAISASLLPPAVSSNQHDPSRRDSLGTYGIKIFLL